MIKKAKMLIFAFFYFFFFLSPSAAEEPSADVIVFSPHPDDETLCCAGTILKATHRNKKGIKVVFLTNGEAFPVKIIPQEDAIQKGEVRQREAAQAIKTLGLLDEDAIFLNYPDSGLSYLWEEKTDKSASPFKKTYGRAKEGYTKENLLSDIKDILREYRPAIIYTPYPLDTHQDHQATTYFLNLALKELMMENRDKWINAVKVRYFLIHVPSRNWPDLNSPIFKEPDIFSQAPAYSENITAFKDKKAEALKAYASQLSIEKNKNFLESFIKNNEIFWDVPYSKSAYLKQLKEEWERIAKIMKREGYNVNLAPVVDVALDSEDMSKQLIKRQRVYSQDPDVVSELAHSVIKGLAEGGIIPVLKHFPGLGAIQTDTHIRLPQAEALKERDLLPFKELIKRCANIWIMVDHAIYPGLSSEPASLSYEIQTELLRNKLRFKGIIIADELLSMQAISEFAYQEKMKEPYIGEIVVRVFNAGGDLALIYPSAGKAEEVISVVIQSVKAALEAGRLKPERIDTSVKRILKEKERIFGRPLLYLFKAMTLEEKICQKIAIDTYKDIGIFEKYNLGGMRARDYTLIRGAQANAKIPMFIMAEHEGGLVNEFALKLYTRSPYLIGKEFERLIVKAGAKVVAENPKAKTIISYAQPKDHLLDFNQLGRERLNTIVSSALDSIDKLIESWSKVKLKGNVVPYPNFISPLTVNTESRFEVKPFEELPIEWLKRFPNQELRGYSYQFIRMAFQGWPENQEKVTDIDKIVAQLRLFKEYIKSLATQEDKSWLRILCIATHPDDEDGEALIYFKRKFNCPTYILLATRGEGGKNKISPLLHEGLGVLRTEEMERSASVLGVDKVYYLGKEDFGYSLDPNEAFEKWERNDTLERLVYFIRLIRPHIIITKHNKFDNNSGQHQAFVILAEEAFDLAGNPKAYQEMRKEGLSPWQPFKFYQRSIIGKGSSRDKKAKINSGEYILSEAKTIKEIALEALKQHRSQGDWHWLETEGPPAKLHYQLVKPKVDSQQESSFFDGIHREK